MARGAAVAVLAVLALCCGAHAWDDTLLDVEVAGSPLAQIAHRAEELAASGVPLVRLGGATGRPEERRVLGQAASTGTTALPTSVKRGMTFFALSADVLGETATLAELKDLKSLGVELVSVVVMLKMDNATANAVETSHNTATDTSLTTFLKTAHGLGLKTMVKPLIVPDGASMYQVRPTKPKEWFASMTTFLLHYATIAQETQAYAMSLGVEFLQMTGPSYAPQWREIALSVRSVFPTGKLTYCSLFVREWHNIQWWHALDWVGIDAYFPMGDASNYAPSVAAMTAQYNQWMGFVRLWRAMSGYDDMPIVITEVGFGSYPSVAATPSTSPPDCTGVYTPDDGAQQRCYQALFNSITHNADLIDTLLMFWFDNPSTPDYYVNATSHGDRWACWFTPRGKPAYDTLAAAFAQP